jgi:hypothetical protein
VIPKEEYERLILTDQLTLSQLQAILNGLHCSESRTLRVLVDKLVESNSRLRKDFNGG